MGLASGEAPDTAGTRDGDTAVLPLSARNDGLPLSAVQEAMFFHALASEAPDVYIVQQRIDIEGRLDPEILRRAWDVLVERHEPLRTVFRWQPGAPPRQVVLDHLAPHFEIVDLTDDPDPGGAADAWLERDRQRRFDLGSGPLTRLGIFRLGDGHHVLTWSQHHLVQDGWSASIVLSELFQIYEALSEGQPPSLPPVRPFRDYLAWLDTQPTDASERFWREALDGFDHPTRMLSQSEDAGDGFLRRSRTLPADLSDRLRQFARDHRLTLNTVLVGAMALLMRRHLGTRDVAMGVVASGRPPMLAGVDSMVGMFINTLVLRVPVDDAARAADWLADVQRRQADVLEHQQSSLPQVQAWSPLGTGTAITDTLFAYWGFGGEGTSPSGAIRYRTVEGYGRTSFPFSVTVASTDPLQVGVDLNRDELDAHQADRFLAQYEALLTELVRDPDCQVGELSVLSAAERRWIDAVNETSAEVPHASVVHAFRAQVRSTPTATALSDRSGAAVSYRELDRWSDRLANEILRLGGNKPTVALYASRSGALVAAMLATMKAGGAFVPIDRHLPPDRVEFLVGDSGADLVACDSRVGNLPPAVSIPILAIDEPAGDQTEPLSEVDPSDLAYVMYTSGSTGNPKGVEVGHDNLVNYVWWAQGEYAAGRPITFPLYTSIGFDLTITSIFVPLVTGGSVVVYGDDDPRALTVIEVFEDDLVDAVKLTPSHLALLEPGHFRDSRIRLLVVGGEDLKTAVAAVPVQASEGRITVYNEYGPTEATVGCMIHRYDRTVDRGASVPIGAPIGNSGVYLLDDQLEPVPEGMVGEIHVIGAGVGRGYAGRPDLTAERFTPLPLAPNRPGYRTGDLGRWIAPGVMEYLGRNDDQIKMRGVRIEPAEIEAALALHPAVEAAAVAVREVRPGDARLVAYLVPEISTPLNITEVRDHLRRRLPDAMVPRHLVEIERLPLTRNGKLDRAALPRKIGQLTTTTTYVAPRNEAERLVAATAADLLGVERVSVADNFFELGGHSILAMELITRLHSATGTRINPRVVLLNTLTGAAAQLPDLGSVGDAEVATGEPSGERASSAFFFGPRHGSLFGLTHAPTGRSVGRRAALLCPPIGWEYMRTHWALRTVARRLADDGYHVLRFDYFATGDSGGESGSGSVARWTDDIRTAHDELRELAGTDEVTLIGVRLGATLAACAAAAGLGAERLVMWDPIVRGRTHLRALEELHETMLSQRRSGRPSQEVVGNELLGFPYPSQLRAELAGLDLTAEREPELPTTVLLSQNDPEIDELRRSWSQRLAVELIPDAGGWDDPSATRAALLPTAIPGRIAGLMGEGR